MRNRRLGLRSSLPLSRDSRLTQGRYDLDADITAILQDLSTLGVRVKDTELLVLPVSDRLQYLRGRPVAIAWNLTVRTQMEFYDPQPRETYAVSTDPLFESSIIDTGSPSGVWSGYGPELIDFAQPLRITAQAPSITVRAQAHLILEGSWQQNLDLLRSRLR